MDISLGPCVVLSRVAVLSVLVAGGLQAQTLADPGPFKTTVSIEVASNNTDLREALSSCLNSSFRTLAGVSVVAKEDAYYTFSVVAVPGAVSVTVSRPLSVDVLLLTLGNQTLTDWGRGAIERYLRSAVYNDHHEVFTFDPLRTDAVCGRITKSIDVNVIENDRLVWHKFQQRQLKQAK